MNEHDMVAQFAELEARARADETDWETFFQAAEAWEKIREAAPLEANWERRTWYYYQLAVDRRVRDYQEEMKPSFWQRLRTKITKRG